jgi:hypothetical protein
VIDLIVAPVELCRTNDRTTASQEEEQRLIVSTDRWTNNSIRGGKQTSKMSTVERRKERGATKQISLRKKEDEATSLPDVQVAVGG